MDEKSMRLGQVARKLNIGKDTIIQKFQDLGVKVENSPNSKISDKHFKLLLDHLHISLDDKEEAHSLTIRNKSEPKKLVKSVRTEVRFGITTPELIEDFRNRIGKPSTVFKYFGTQSYNLEGLEKSYLYHSPFHFFNDPFDCCLSLLSFESKVKTDEIEFQKRLKDAGICCFSRKRDSILMWSHYAEKHQGFCLEFVTNIRLDGINPLDVNYVTNFNKADFNHNPDTAVFHLVYTKSKAWEYEEELRALVPNLGKDELRKIRYRSEDLKAIYLGVNSTDSLVKQIIDIVNLKYPDTSIFKAEKSVGSFSLRFNQIHPRLSSK